MREQASDLAPFISDLVSRNFDQVEVIQGEALEPYNKCTFPTKNKVLLVIKPKPTSLDKQDRYRKIIDVVEMAKKHLVHIYPISCGKNWGYGSTSPMGTAIVILDLSLFNLIQEFDDVSHQVCVEPGVTQQQLYDFLKQNGDLYLMDSTGAPTTSSIVGNTLECGFGHSSIAERSKNVLNLTLLIPGSESNEPELMSSSLIGTYDQTNSFKRIMNLGPDFTQLAMQSNYFVTLNMTISLKMKPDAFCAYFIDLNTEQFPHYIALARRLRNLGVIHSASHIGNKHKAIQMAVKHYPYDELNNTTPLSEDYIKNICDYYGLADWTVSGAFYGTKERVKADMNALKSEVATLGAKVMFIDDRRLEKINKLASFLNQNKLGKSLVSLISKVSPTLSVPFRKLGMLEDLKALYHLKKGVPTDHFVKTTFWRTKLDGSNSDLSNPNDDRTGFIWIAPCVQICPTRISKLEKTIATITRRYGFEPALSITLLNERAAECVVSLSFNRLNENEEKNAMKCHEEILLECAKIGAYVYRLSTESAEVNIARFLQQDHKKMDLKNVFDPMDIIAPGKYRGI
jgi:4-cresol dehydrogenase (hydroxylating)